MSNAIKNIEARLNIAAASDKNFVSDTEVEKAFAPQEVYFEEIAERAGEQTTFGFDIGRTTFGFSVLRKNGKLNTVMTMENALETPKPAQVLGLISEALKKLGSQ